MKPRLRFIFPFRPLVFATLSLSFSGSLRADDIYWDGPSTSSWNDVANWSTDPGAATPDPAMPPGAGDMVHFSIALQPEGRTVNLIANQTVQGILTENLTGTIFLRGGNDAPVDFTIGAGGIDHQRGGLTIGTSEADRVNILLAASQRWNSAAANSGASAIMVVNDVSGTGNQTLTLDGSNLGSYIGGAISDGTGMVSIVKEGSGIWELRGANTYTGTTQVNAGILRLANFTAASPDSALNVADGATLSLRIGGTTGMTAGEADTLRSRINYESSAAFLGLEAASSFTYGSDIAGDHGLMKTGSTTLTFSGNNSYTGDTVITSGYLAFTDTAAVSANSNIIAKAGGGVYAYAGGDGFTVGELDALRTAITYEDDTAAFGISTENGSFSYDSAMSGAHGFVKAGGNTLTFGGSESNTYTGSTRVAGGTLMLSKTGGATAIAGDVNVTGGALQLDGSNQIADTAVITASGGSINFRAKNETVAGLALSNTATFSTGNTTGGPTSVVNLGVVTAEDTSRITVNSGGKIVADSISLTTENRTDGNILLGGAHEGVVSELEIGAGGLTMTGQTIQVNRTTNAAHDGTRITLNGDFTGSGENLMKLSGTTSSLAELSMGSGERTFNITADNTQIDLNVAGDTLVKTGAGALALSGDNTYTGLTKVNAGVLRVLGDNALGGTTAGTEVAGGGQVRLENNVTVTDETLTIRGVTSGSAINSGLLNFSGDNVWAGDIILDVSVNQNTRLNMTGGTLDIRGDVFIDGGSITSNGLGVVLTGDGGTGTISGNISGNGNNQNVIKNGASTWVLSGTNSYTGVTRVDDGVLSVQSIADQLGSPSNTDNARINLGEGSTSGTFRYTGTGEDTDRGFRLRSFSTGNGTIEQAGTGTLTISGEINGASTASDKTLTLTGSTAGTGELTGTFSDTAGDGKTHVVKSGSGTWTLSGAGKDYEGTTTVIGGVLNVTTSLTQSTAVSVTNGTFNIGANNVIKDDAAVTLGGDGILQIAGFTDAAGVLAVTGSSQLKLAGGSNSLSFADSSGADWTGAALAITGWSGLAAGNDQLLFDAAGLTDSQRSSITFVNPDGFEEGVYSAKFVGFELVPDVLIPEPSSIVMLLTGTTCLLLQRRRGERTV